MRILTSRHSTLKKCFPFFHLLLISLTSSTLNLLKLPPEEDAFPEPHVYASSNWQPLTYSVRMKLSSAHGFSLVNTVCPMILLDLSIKTRSVQLEIK